MACDVLVWRVLCWCGVCCVGVACVVLVWCVLCWCGVCCVSVVCVVLVRRVLCWFVGMQVYTSFICIAR